MDVNGNANHHHYEMGENPPPMPPQRAKGHREFNQDDLNERRTEFRQR